MNKLRAWLLRGRPYPYPRHVASSAMALLYLVGGLTALLTLLLPHPKTLHFGVMIVIGCCSAPNGARHSTPRGTLFIVPSSKASLGT